MWSHVSDILSQLWASPRDLEASVRRFRYGSGIARLRAARLTAIEEDGLSGHAGVEEEQ